jgi:DNA-binding protein Fis
MGLLIDINQIKPLRQTAQSLLLFLRQIINGSDINDSHVWGLPVLAQLRNPLLKRL